jgi:hypothetical protein
MISGLACEGTTVPITAILLLSPLSRTALPAPIGPFEPKAKMPFRFG